MTLCMQNDTNVLFTCEKSLFFFQFFFSIFFSLKFTMCLLPDSDVTFSKDINNRYTQKEAVRLNEVKAYYPINKNDTNWNI